MMANILTFIIPVLNPGNVTNWPRIKVQLSQTINSIAAQDRAGWKAVVVANHGADLPDMPIGFEVKRVDFPPTDFEPSMKAETAVERLELRYHAIRGDRGRRILAGMLHAGEMGHAMTVDYDDFVSRRLTSFVAANPAVNGWFFKTGLIWTDGGRLLYEHNDFSHLCGTSHIIKSQLFKLPAKFEAATDEYIRIFLGSHIFLHDHLDATGTPLAPLPFPGAIYRTGQPGASSSSRGILRSYIIKRKLALNPNALFSNISKLSLKTKKIEEEYFGRSAINQLDQLSLRERSLAA